ncbi:MAG: hypothetical protein QXJ74_01650 [Nitrososphaera sp.]
MTRSDNRGKAMTPKPRVSSTGGLKSNASVLLAGSENMNSAKDD